MRQIIPLLAVLILIAAPHPVEAAQGQWGGFIYIFPPKQGGSLPDEEKNEILMPLKRAAQKFDNDFTPQISNPETIQYYKNNRYTVEGVTVDGARPIGLIRVESRDRGRVEDYYVKVIEHLEDYYDIYGRLGKTGNLNYTDKATLQRLKTHAPTRGNGRNQPNVVVFPLSKTMQWWDMDPKKRRRYFYPHPEIFGDRHVGHNEIGFQYIERIFRKLYYSGEVDTKQNFITYFEFANENREAFKNLLNRLRNREINPEWKYVREEPIFWGTRKQTLDEILGG